MVVDPSRYDVSDLRERSIDDTSNSGDDNHGFVWVRNETEAESQGDNANHHQNNENTTSSQSDTQSKEKSHSQNTGEKITDLDKNTASNQTTHSSDGGFTYQESGQTEDKGPGFQWSNTTNESASETQSQSLSETESESQLQEKPTESFEGWDSNDSKFEKWDDNGLNNDIQSDTETHNSDSSTQQHTETTADGQSAESTTGKQSVVNGDDGGQEQQYAKTAIDPINYDISELQAISDCDIVDHLSNELETEVHGFVWSDPPEEHRSRIEDPTPEQHQRLLTLEGIDPEMVGEKPYLTRISTEAAGAFISDWLEFLTHEAGTEGAINAIERYHEIGWFTKSVEEDLQNRIRWNDHYDGNGYKVFDRGDHLLSFAYIAKIASVNSEGMVFY